MPPYVLQGPQHAVPAISMSYRQLPLVAGDSVQHGCNTRASEIRRSGSRYQWSGGATKEPRRIAATGPARRPGRGPEGREVDGLANAIER